MKTNRIKTELIEWLSGVEDDGVLTSLLLFKRSTESGDWTDHLTKQQLESIQRGLADIENGNVMSSKDFGNSYGRN